MNRMSDFICLYIGVNHGEPLSPLLFVVFINDMVSESENLTAFTLNQMQIFILLFADDTVLLSDSPVYLQLLLDKLYASQHRQNQNNGIQTRQYAG